MDKLFPTKTKSNPQIYAYQDLYNPHLKGLLKVGYTTIDPIIRVQQQYNITKPGGAPYRIVFTESAMRPEQQEAVDKTAAYIELLLSPKKNYMVNCKRPHHTSLKFK